MLGSIERMDIEKRLKLLRQQVYGKKEFRVQNSDFSEKDRNKKYETKTVNLSDITYLRQDLVRIIIFATLAFALQLILLYLLQNY